MASGVTSKFLQALMAGDIDWANDTFKAQLTLDSYTFDPDTHDFRDDVTAHAAAGCVDQTIPSTAITPAPASDKVFGDCGASIEFTSVTGSQSVRGITIYKSRGGASSADELIEHLEFSGGAQDTGAGMDITVSFDANGCHFGSY